MGKSRRTGVAALVLVTLTITMSGCLSSRPPKFDEGVEGRIELPAAATPLPGGKPLVSKPETARKPEIVSKPEIASKPEIKKAAFFQDGPAKGKVKDKDVEKPPLPEKLPYVAGPAHPIVGATPPGPIPGELRMSSHPPYTIAPPDILVIDAVRLIPRPPYRIEPLEVLLVNVGNTLPGQPISGPFVVSPEGTINLGFSYGAVRVGGLTLEQAQTAVRNHLLPIIKAPEVTIALAQFRGLQQVRGQHLVRPDGTISLGTYGAVYIAGLTIGQAKCVIEKHLSEYLLNPQVSIDVFSYNSKFYYVILDGAGLGQQVLRIPSTGNETVLDAIAVVQGLAPVSSKKRIWLARPSPVAMGCNQILPVDWEAITMAASTATNYQVFPGDRIYVHGDCLIRLDNTLAKILAPIERILGVTLLGATTVQTLNNLDNPNSNFGGAVFIP